MPRVTNPATGRISVDGGETWADATGITVTDGDRNRASEAQVERILSLYPQVTGSALRPSYEAACRVMTPRQASMMIEILLHRLAANERGEATISSGDIIEWREEATGEVVRMRIGTAINELRDGGVFSTGGANVIYPGGGGGGGGGYYGGGATIYYGGGGGDGGRLDPTRHCPNGRAHEPYSDGSWPCVHCGWGPLPAIEATRGIEAVLADSVPEAPVDPEQELPTGVPDGYYLCVVSETARRYYVNTDENGRQRIGRVNRYGGLDRWLTVDAAGAMRRVLVQGVARSAIRYGTTTQRCACCNQRLRDDVSLTRGVGTRCIREERPLAVAMLEHLGTEIPPESEHTCGVCGEPTTHMLANGTQPMCDECAVDADEEIVMRRRDEEEWIDEDD